jgi:YggT family protein
VNAVLHWVGVLLYLYGLVLLARFVMELVTAYTRYRPSGSAAVAFEFVYSVTDPPLRALRRVIPPLPIGSVNLDLSFIVLVIAIQIVAGLLI